MDPMEIFHGISFLTLLYFLLALATVAFIVFLVLLKLTTWNAVPKITRMEGEKYFKDPNKNNATYPFPFMEQEGSVDLSVIVPSYNEEQRLPVMLDETIDYLEKRKKSKPSFTYEVIIVDDGSADKTSEVALQYSKKFTVSCVRVLTFTRNRGKGGAVRLGVFSSRGSKILFADADAATKFSDLERLENALEKMVGPKNNKAIVVGSRSHLQDEAVAQRSVFRNILMYGFHFLVWFLCVKGIKDTQCGFKLLTRPAAFLTFSALHIERWAFDVELLYIAQYLKIPVAEVAVNWTEIDGSKMIPVWSWLQMGKDLLLIRLRYIIGAWKVEPIKLKSF